MFDRIKRAFGQVANAFRRFAGDTKNAADATANLAQELASPPAHPPAIRYRYARQIPFSSMTKKGPGITAAVRRALASMTIAQRLAARAKGWDRGMVDASGRLR